MPKRTTWRMGCKNEWIVAGIGALLVTVGGCAGEAPKPVPTITQDQVRGNAERAFEKLKQEEKNRPTDTGVVSY